jgi:hypothetical protein
LHEPLDSVDLYFDFYLLICLKNLKGCPFVMVKSGIYCKSPNSTSTTFCKENVMVSAQPS